MHLLLLLFGMVLSAAIPAQGTIETEFTAKGCCGMCGTRIENALDVKGVRYAEWNNKEQKVLVVFKTKKVSVQDLEQLVAAVGHDTEHVQADDDVYAALPGCCLYRNGCAGCSDDGSNGDER